MSNVIPLSKDRIEEQRKKYEKERKDRARERVLAAARKLKW